MSVKLIVMTTLDPNEPEALNEYLAVAGPLTENAGAKLLERHETTKVIHGESVAQFIMILEYPSVEAIETLFDSQEYKSIIKARDKAFTSYQVAILA